jgi:hypothetical protein
LGHARKENVGNLADEKNGMNSTIAIIWLLAFTVYTKELFDFSMFGFNFALWDIFILIPLLFKKIRVKNASVLLALSLAYIIVIGLSGLLNAQFSKSSIGYLLQYMRCLAIFMTLYTLLARNEILVNRHLFLSFLSFNALTLLLTIIGFREHLGEFSAGGRWRLGGFVGDPNFFGFYAVLCLLSLFYLFEKRQIRFGAFGLSALFLGFVIFLTGSRSAIGLYFGFVLVFLYRANFKTAIGIYITLAMPSFIIFASSFQQLYAYFQVRFSQPDSRFALWYNLVEKLNFESLFGNGVKSAVYLLGNFAHNDWLTAIYELGVFGFGVFALINLWVYVALLKFKISYIVPSLLLTFLFSIFAQPVLWIYWVMAANHIRSK